MEVQDLKWMMYACFAILFFALSYTFFKLGSGQGEVLAFLLIVSLINSIGHLVLFILYLFKKRFATRDTHFIEFLKDRIYLPIKVILFSILVGFSAAFNDMSSMLMFKAGAPFSISMPIFTSSVVCLTVLFGVFVLKEKLSVRQFVGISMIIMGIILFNV